MSEIVAKIQKSSIRLLNQMVQEVVSGPELSMQSDDVLMEFITQMNNHFDRLMGKEVFEKEVAVVDFETLSLVQEEELEAMVALDGMVTAARNEHLNNFIAFNTRLDSLFPDRRIDESISPLDPEQIASAFQDATQPVKLDAGKSLTVFRGFNTHVLKKLDQVLNDANNIMIEAGVMTDLNLEVSEDTLTPLKARSMPRENPDPVSSFGEVESMAPTEEAEPGSADTVDPVEFVPTDTADTVEPLPADTVETVEHVAEEEIEELFPLDEALQAAADEEPAPGEDHSDTGSDTEMEEAIDAEDDHPELFSIVQNLMHGGDSTEGGGATSESSGATVYAGGEQHYMIPASMLPAGVQAADGEPLESGSVMRAFKPKEGQKVEMVDQGQLMQILTNIQDKLSDIVPSRVAGSPGDVQKLNINESLGQVLQDAATDDSISALDRKSSDIINLVTLLFEAIWQDHSVPIPIKELIGRTQITIIKVALADVDFFNNENHPARAMLNDFAAAGIGWTEVEALEEDPLYLKIQQLVERILNEFDNDIALFEELTEDFQQFRSDEAAKTSQLEERILKADERRERLDDIHELVTQKIEERVLGRDLHPFVEELLNDLFHKFMVMLVLKEGPGGNAWKQAINTVDVLLWSVQPKEHEGDLDRLATVNPRLMSNLKKALRITGIDNGEIEVLLAQLGRVQEDSFEEVTGKDEDEAVEADIEIAEDLEELLEETIDETTHEAAEADEDVRFLAAGEFDETESGEQEEADEAAAPAAVEDEAEVLDTEAEELTDDHPSMLQVDGLQVGTWVEFSGEDEHNTRCKLAARINAIDKFIFVNRQGVKVVEKTKMGLARELHDGTVSIVSEGQLFSRALESVIGDLRESQQKQQTGSAYQPQSKESA